MTDKIRLTFFAALVAVVGSAQAVDPIPAEPGWSEFVTLGINSISNIDFYSTSSTLFGLGAQYRF
jgi:hypothetical protein